MNRQFKLAAFSSAILAIGVVSTPASAQQTITVYVDGRHILSTDTYTFEIYDRVCNQGRGTVTVSGGEQNAAAVRVCAGGTGKGSITYRNVTLNGRTVGEDFLNDGDHVHP